MAARQQFNFDATWEELKAGMEVVFQISKGITTVAFTVTKWMDLNGFVSIRKYCFSIVVLPSLCARLGMVGCFLWRCPRCLLPPFLDLFSSQQSPRLVHPP